MFLCWIADVGIQKIAINLWRAGMMGKYLKIEEVRPDIMNEYKRSLTEKFIISSYPLPDCSLERKKGNKKILVSQSGSRKLDIIFFSPENVCIIHYLKYRTVRYNSCIIHTVYN